MLSAPTTTNDSGNALPDPSPAPYPPKQKPDSLNPAAASGSKDDGVLRDNKESKDNGLYKSSGGLKSNGGSKNNRGSNDNQESKGYDNGSGGVLSISTPAAGREATSEVSFADIVGSTPPTLPPERKSVPVSVGDTGSAKKGVTTPGEAWAGKGGGARSGGIGGRSTNWKGGKAAVGSGGWVSTGDAVAFQYVEARKEAAELAR